MSRKLCACGCKMPLPLSKYTDPRYGAVKGKPCKFILGHSSKGMNRKGHHIELTGKVFGALTVLGMAFRVGGSDNSRILWWALCKCGKKKAILGASLRGGLTRSCGCGWGTQRRVHGCCTGGVNTPEYTLWVAAKKRAKQRRIPFNMSVHDIVIPKKCPILGIKLKSHHVGKPGIYDDSPTLDRIIPRCGYTKNNTWVISGRANKAKSNLSLRELELLVKALRKRMQHGKS